jgi:hypothetical protein
MFIPRDLVLPVLRRAVVGLAIASTAAAQSAGDGFLFGAPQSGLTFRLGYAAAAASSDVFAFTTDLLTLDRRDFSGTSLEADYAFRIGRRTHLVFSAQHASAGKRSEFRDFVDQDNNPIEQTTRFERLPLTIGVRRYLTSPGRGIGNFAWVPAKVAPFVGVGAGVLWYRFRQSGDFIDFANNEVFTTTLESIGWSPAARVMAGAEFSVGPRMALTIQGSYLRADARLGTDFSGFEPIDLSGFSTSIGFSTRF